jgi:hypothetical protein
VICRSTREFERLLTERLRPITGVRTIEIFLYLDCTKDSYNWCNP